MSAHAPHVGPAVIREVSERLSAPLPEKTRFLQELASDLRELTGRLMADGMSSEEARARATEALVPDAETTARLDHLYAPRYARVTRRWGAQRLRFAERGLLAVSFLALLLLQSAAILRTDLARYASPFLWPVIAAGSLVVVAVIGKGFEMWVKRDHAHLRGGLSTILGLAPVPTLIATVGMWADLHALASALELHPELARHLVIDSIGRDASLLAIAMLFGLFGAVGWLIASQWIAVQEDAHQRALALDSTLFQEM